MCLECTDNNKTETLYNRNFSKFIHILCWSRNYKLQTLFQQMAVHFHTSKFTKKICPFLVYKYQTISAHKRIPN